MVTVIDPRHPLYGQTFRLIQVEDRPNRGECCLVERDWGQNSYISLSVTDKSKTGWISSNTPLSVKSIRQLVSTYILLSEDEKNGTTHSSTTSSNKDSSQRSLVTSDFSAENTGSSITNSSLSNTDAEVSEGASKK